MDHSVLQREFGLGLLRRYRRPTHILHLFERLLSIIAMVLLGLATPSMSIELFRYCLADEGKTLEFVFQSDEHDVHKTVGKERVAEIAANFMTTFYRKTGLRA